MTEEQDRAAELQQIGKRAMASIRDMVAALECDYERLAELRGARADNPDEAEELTELEAAAGDCASREDAERCIWDDPFSIQVRSDWHDLNESDGYAVEYCILLSTGGPATRIVGDLSRGKPVNARLEAQDWFTQWTEYTGGDNEDDRTLMAWALMSYVDCFCFDQ